MSGGNHRIPDVCLLSRVAPREEVVTVPPLAVFEVLSPKDSFSEMYQRLDDYQQMGIPAIWVIEPKRLKYYRFSSGQLMPATLFELPGTEFHVEMSEIAALVD
jgi:Uma2 family endonuclease